MHNSQIAKAIYKRQLCTMPNMAKAIKNTWNMAKAMLRFNKAKRQAHNKDTKSSRLATYNRV